MHIFQNKQASVSYDKNTSCIIWTPEGYLKNEIFSQPFKEGLDFIETHHKTKPIINWLNDTRNLRMVAINDINWLNKNVNDRAYRLGIKRVAFVLPDNYYGKLAISIYANFTRQRSDNEMEIKAFNKMEDAKLWLSQGTISEEAQFI